LKKDFGDIGNRDGFNNIKDGRDDPLEGKEGWFKKHRLGVRSGRKRHCRRNIQGV